jgi:hypothetical protein
LSTAIDIAPLWGFTLWLQQLSLSNLQRFLVKIEVVFFGKNNMGIQLVKGIGHGEGFCFAPPDLLVLVEGFLLLTFRPAGASLF